MKISISSEVLEKFPGLNIGVLIAKGINNAGKDDKITKLLEETEELVRNEIELAVKKAKREYHTSVEILIKKIVKGEKINIVNKLADIYRYVSLKYLIPIGGFDLSQTVGDVELAVSDGTDFLVPAGKGEKEKAKKGEIIYRDDIEVLCRKWNWKYAYKTRVSQKSKNAIIFIDGIPPLKKEEVKKALDELNSLIPMFCKGETASFILSKDEPEREV